MTIQELADRAAVTTRTIRYYVEQGVLPPPERGRPAEYTEEHVRLLALVRRLKEQYLPLEEIREMLQRLTPEQVEQFLGRTEPVSQEPQSQGSAADYIAQVLTRGAFRSQLKGQVAPQPPAPQAPAPAPAAASRPPVPQTPPRRSTLAGATEASEASLFDETGPVAHERQRETSYETASHREAYMSEERTWQRVTLAPGVELHYEAQLSGGLRAAIERLIEAARTILGSNQEKGAEEQK